MRNRLNSVKAIRKITSSMKMVAASKLRVAQTFLEKTVRPFAATYKTVDVSYLPFFFFFLSLPFTSACYLLDS